MSRVLIVDVSYLMFRSYFGYPNLTTKIETENGLETMPIGAFFGFTKTVLTIIKNYQIDELILASDLPLPTWRHDLYDNYKSGRKKMDENLRVQIPLINDWCAQITKNFLSLRGLEADDLIASSVINLNINLNLQTLKDSGKIQEKNKQNIDKIETKELENKQNNTQNNKGEIDKTIDKMENFLDFRNQYFFKKNLEKQSQNLDLTINNKIKTKKIIQTSQDSKFFIYSKDRDLFQLLVFDNVFFVENESNFQVFGQIEFEKKYQLHPSQWLCYKTLVGDPSDKLDGIAGIGPKTATTILQKYKSVTNFVSKIDGQINQKIDQKLIKWQDKINIQKIAKIRHLSSLCWIDLELESGFDLQNGLTNLVKYKLGSLINMQNQIHKQTSKDFIPLPNPVQNSKKTEKNIKNLQNSKIEMEDLF